MGVLGFEDALAAAHRLAKGFDPSEARDDQGQWTAGGGGFASATPAAFVAARDASSRSQFLSGHTAAELADHKLFLSHDGKVGYALDPKGGFAEHFQQWRPQRRGKGRIG